MGDEEDEGAAGTITADEAMIYNLNRVKDVLQLARELGCAQNVGVEVRVAFWVFDGGTETDILSASIEAKETP